MHKCICNVIPRPVKLFYFKYQVRTVFFALKKWSFSSFKACSTDVTFYVTVAAAQLQSTLSDQFNFRNICSYNIRLDRLKFSVPFSLNAYQHTLILQIFVIIVFAILHIISNIIVSKRTICSCIFVCFPNGRKKNKKYSVLLFLHAKYFFISRRMDVLCIFSSFL